MIEYLRTHQLNIMEVFVGVCVAIILLLLFTKAIPTRRRKILMSIEISAFLLLFFDRLAYEYSGNITRTGYIMVRLSNFIVFFMSVFIVFVFNIYLFDLLRKEGGLTTFPNRLKVAGIVSVIGMILIIVSQFTGLYYTFDESNVYHRSPAFIVCFIFPFIASMLQLTVAYVYRKQFGKWIYISLVLFMTMPFIAGIIQVFTYGLSPVNITIAIVAMFLYIFAHLHINEEMEKSHNARIRDLEEEKKNIRDIFDKTVKSFVNALDGRYVHTRGHSQRVADYARRIAEMDGKSSDECDDMPDIDVGAHYHCERYDGRGYPDGLKGEDIPEAARIIAAADAYDLLASETDMTPPMPAQLIREQFVQKSGQQLDPKYAKIVMQLLDRMEAERTEDASSTVAAVYENEFVCNEYRDHVMAGIVVENEPTRIRMKCDPAKNAESDFYCPSLIVFDSYDGRVHDTQKEIDAFRYTEFGEVWFDGHIVCNGARNMEVNVHRRSSGPDIPGSEDDASSYEIITYRQNDHVRIIINSEETSCDVTVALPDSSLFAYIGLTGEHCHTSNVTIEKMENASNLEDIPRIADPISYIDRLESDLPNVQIDGKRSASTEGVRITDGMRIIFHTMSLPSADLIWHCPYIILFSSKDGTVGGEDYTEYGLIGMHGETRKTDEIAQNVIAVDRDDDFVGWDEWKEANHKGLECIVHFRKLGNRITVITQNSGIRIENETTIMDSVKDVYAAITGDQVAITDIRVKKT